MANWTLLESLISITFAKTKVLGKVDFGLIVDNLLNQFSIHFSALFNSFAHSKHVVVCNLLLGCAGDSIVMQISGQCLHHGSSLFDDVCDFTVLGIILEHSL